LHLVAESCTICSSCSRQPVWKLWIHPCISYTNVQWFNVRTSV